LEAQQRDEHLDEEADCVDGMLVLWLQSEYQCSECIVHCSVDEMIPLFEFSELICEWCLMTADTQ